MGTGIIVKTSIVNTEGIVCLRGVFKKTVNDKNVVISFYADTHDETFIPCIPYFESCVPVSGRHIRLFRQNNYDAIVSNRQIDLKDFEHGTLFDKYVGSIEKTDIREISFTAEGVNVKMLNELIKNNHKYYRGDIYVRVQKSMLTNKTNVDNTTMYVVAAKVVPYIRKDIENITPKIIGETCITSVYKPAVPDIEHGNIPTIMLKKPEDVMVMNELFHIRDMSAADVVTSQTYVANSIFPVFSSLSLLDEQFELLDSIRRFDIKFDYALPEEDIAFISSMINTPRPIVDFKQYVLFIVTMYLYRNIENVDTFCNQIWVKKYFHTIYPDRNYISFVASVLESIYPLCDTRQEYIDVLMFLFIYMDVGVSIKEEEDIKRLAEIYDTIAQSYESSLLMSLPNMIFMSVYKDTDIAKTLSCMANAPCLKINNTCLRFWVIDIVRRMVKERYMPDKITCTCIEELLLPFGSFDTYADITSPLEKHFNGFSEHSLYELHMHFDTIEYLKAVELDISDVRTLFEISFARMVYVIQTRPTLDYVDKMTVFLIIMLSKYTFATKDVSEDDSQSLAEIVGKSLYLWSVLDTEIARIYFEKIKPVMVLLFETLDDNRNARKVKTRTVFTNSTVRLVETVLSRGNVGTEVEIKDVDYAAFLGYLCDRSHTVFLKNGELNIDMSKYIPDIVEFVLLPVSSGVSLEYNIERFKKSYPVFFKFLLKLFSRFRCDSGLQPKEAAMVMSVI